MPPLVNPEHAYADYMRELFPGEDFSQYHIKVRADDVARYALVLGPDRAGRAGRHVPTDIGLLRATAASQATAGRNRRPRPPPAWPVIEVTAKLLLARRVVSGRRARHAIRTVYLGPLGL